METHGHYQQMGECWRQAQLVTRPAHRKGATLGLGPSLYAIEREKKKTEEVKLSGKGVSWKR